MAQKRLKRPRDPIALAKLVGDIATGRAKDSAEDKRSTAAVELGKKGGKARAKSMTQEERTEAARKAAQLRWAARSK